MGIGIIIQARLGSTRLPNKVLKPLFMGQTTVIKEIIDRSQLVKNIDTIIVASSNNPKDDKLIQYLKKFKNLETFRGDEDNVLSRYCSAAEQFRLDHIVRLTGDNPCIDITIIEHAIKSHLESKADYTYTTGYPLGMNVEIVRTSALFEAREKDISKPNREHVTYFIRNSPDQFKLNYVQAPLSKNLSSLRLTVDTPQDYLMIQILFDYLKPMNPNFGIAEIQECLNKNPYLFEINAMVKQKQVYTQKIDELKAAYHLLIQQELTRAAQIIKKNIEG